MNLHRHRTSLCQSPIGSNLWENVLTSLPREWQPEIRPWRIFSSVCCYALLQKFLRFRIPYSKELSNVQIMVLLCFGTITFSEELDLDLLDRFLFSCQMIALR